MGNFKIVTRLYGGFGALTAVLLAMAALALDQQGAATAVDDAQLGQGGVDLGALFLQLGDLVVGARDDVLQLLRAAFAVVPIQIQIGFDF